MAVGLYVVEGGNVPVGYVEGVTVDDVMTLTALHDKFLGRLWGDSSLWSCTVWYCCKFRLLLGAVVVMC